MLADSVIKVISDDVIQLGNDAVRLEILPRGAALRRFDVATPDGWRNIILGHPHLTDYDQNPGYLGATLGRFANRLGAARFSLDGLAHQVDPNEPPNQLHGGSDGFGRRCWSVTDAAADHAELSLVSPDGDQGYPGELRMTARFRLIAGGVEVVYRATTSAPTVVNLTTHPYFNLDGEGSGTIDGHRLWVGASAYTPTHEDGVPTGEVRDVTGSAADFRGEPVFGQWHRRAVAEGITRNGGYDHNFVVDGAGLRDHCRLTGTSGLSVTVRSDRPALQVYDGEHFIGEPGTSGKPYPVRAGLALETQAFPDAPNHPNFPSTVLRPGEEYVTTTQWLVTTVR